MPGESISAAPSLAATYALMLLEMWKIELCTAGGMDLRIEL